MVEEKIEKKDKAPILEMIILSLIIIIPVAFSGYGKWLEHKAMDRCSEEVLGYVADVHVEDYLYAPYYGGVVTTKYNTYVTYAFDTGEETYIVIMKAYYNRVDYPKVMSFKYNPDDPSEFFWDVSEWNEHESPEWRYSKNIKE